MKYELFVLLVMLLAPAVAAPERMISSCNARAIVNKGYVLDGRTIGGKPVEILVPCISKADLAQLLEDFLAAEKPQIKGQTLHALREAGDVTVTLTTKMTWRKVD